MPISREECLHVARLARLALTEQEIERFTEQLSVIIDHAERVKALATGDLPATSHALALTNVMRPDEIEACLPQEAALANAPAVEDRRFKVPRILEEPE